MLGRKKKHVRKVTLYSNDLWHQGLGHINFRDLSKISKKKATCLPNL
jgi:hypothetical protein